MHVISTASYLITMHSAKFVSYGLMFCLCTWLIQTFSSLIRNYSNPHDYTKYDEAQSFIYHTIVMVGGVAISKGDC